MKKIDHTKAYDYQRLIEEEKEHYLEIEVTEDLKEGGVHASDSWGYYWKQVAEIIHASPFGSVAEYVRRELGQNGKPIEVLSLGSGYCGNELDFARFIGKPCRVVCTDINDKLFTDARAVAEREDLNLEFRVEDLNFIEIEPGRYDMIFAHAVLHHVINLENLYGQIVSGLAKNGIFHVVEVVGKNRKLIWDENERFANALLDSLPTEITGGMHLDAQVEEEGMEGIRQEEILPLLQQSFEPLFEYNHGAFMRYVCTNPTLTQKFDPNMPLRRRCLDFLIDCDIAAVRNGILRPLEIWGVYRPR